MHFAVPPRSSRLVPLVSALGYYESTLPAGRDRVLPGGGTGLMVNLHEDEFRTYHGPGATVVRRAPGRDGRPARRPARAVGPGRRGAAGSPARRGRTATPAGRAGSGTAAPP